MSPTIPERRPHACFVPPYLLERMDRADLLHLDATFRQRRVVLDVAAPTLLPDGTLAADGPAWVVHDAGGTEELPGRVVRRAGEPASGDAAVDEAATGITASLALFAEVYGRDSYDDRGATVVLSVHYGQDYVNAFWDGTQLVFGDGDGQVFDRFTKAVDVLAHELTHAVTERTAALAYQGQSGALNESVSDVFAACLEQRLAGQSAEEGDWLIGSELFLPGVSARGLRDMRDPGTAYDDPALGQDPQPAHLDDYVETTDDNGGVHINSGIPNRAFYLAATGIGGSSAEGAGRIWYDALTGGRVGPDTDFAGFAAATVAVAGPHAEAVTAAWEGVGVSVADPGADAGSGAGAGTFAPAPSGTVRVRRSGGFAGLVAEAEVDLESGADPRCAELRGLVAEVDPPTAARLGEASAQEPPGADRYVYRFELPGLPLAGSELVLGEQHLTPGLRRIAGLVLDE